MDRDELAEKVEFRSMKGSCVKCGGEFFTNNPMRALCMKCNQKRS